jgi:hypothetical protein
MERAFHRAMTLIYEAAKCELGYNTARFLQMISEHGGLAARPPWSDKPSEGFTTLRQEPFGGTAMAASRMLRWWRSCSTGTSNPR